MSVKVVLFDLDGTLLDTSDFVYQAYEYSLVSHNLKSIKRDKLAKLIGKDIATIYGIIAPGVDPKPLIKTHLDFQSGRLDLVKTFPGVLEVVKKLKKLGLKLGVVTSRVKNTKLTLKVGSMENLFDVIVSAADVTNFKPHPETVFLALKKLKVKPNEALLVGDAAADIEMGKNAKVKTVGVTFGFGGKDIKKSKPDFVIDKMSQLLEVLKLS